MLPDDSITRHEHFLSNIGDFWLFLEFFLAIFGKPHQNVTFWRVGKNMSGTSENFLTFCVFFLHLRRHLLIIGNPGRNPEIIMDDRAGSGPLSLVRAGSQALFLARIGSRVK